MSRRLTPRSTRLTRREMLRNTTLAGIGIWTAAAGSSDGQSRSPNEKLSIAGIGVAGQGGWDIGNCASENIVALCDVDDRRSGPFGKEIPEGEEVPRLPQDARRDGQTDRRGSRGHARPHPRPRRGHGHEDGQTLLLREAVGPLRGRGPDDDRTGNQEQAGHPDGHPDPCRAELSPRGRVGPVGGDRRGGRGPRVAHRGVWRRRPPQGNAARAAGARLGPLARPGAAAPVSSVLLSGQSGEAGGISAAAAWATSAATTWTCRSGP